MVTLPELAEPKHTVTWCPGCGNFSIVTAVKKAMVNLGYKPHETVFVSGIGCSGKTPHFIHTYGYESIHGRALPAASGIKLANHNLNVIVGGGDGDGMGIGTNHFVHACRRNYNMTYIMHDNFIYGLTTGQTSPTSEQGFKSKSTPEGVLEVAVNPIALALTMGATYVARSFAMDMEHLTRMIEGGMKHRGFAFIDIAEHCLSWNKINTNEYFKNKIYHLEESDYDPKDKMAAYEKSQQWSEKIPIGLFYKEDRPLYEDGLPQLKNEPLAKKPIDNVDISRILDIYK